MSKILGRLVRIILTGVLFLFLLLIAAEMISHYIWKQSPADIFGFSPVIVLSGSMEPTFSAGDLLIIQQQESYREREIVMYEDGGVLTTHRIVGRQLEGFITQGDNNNIPDSQAVSPGQIKGGPCPGDSAGRNLYPVPADAQGHFAADSFLYTGPVSA